MAVRLLIVAMMVLSFAACGDDDDTEDDFPGTTATAATSPTIAAGEAEASPTASRATATRTPLAVQTEEPTETPRQTPTSLLTSTPAPTATVEPAPTTEPTATTEPTPTTEPTATVEATATTKPTATSQAAQGGGEEDDQLAEVVLSLSDVPDGWVASVEDEDDDDPNICDMEDVRSLYPDRSHARSAFEGSQTGPFVASFITTLGADEASELLTYVRETFGSCGTWTSTSNGQTSTFTASEMSFPEVGDDRYAVQLNGTVGTFPYVAEIVYVQFGEHIISLSHFGLNDVDTNLTNGWVETMVERALGLGS